MTTQTVSTLLITLNGDQFKQLQKAVKCFKLTRASKDYERHVKVDILENSFTATIQNETDIIQLSFPIESTEYTQGSFIVPFEVFKNTKGIKKDSIYSLTTIESNQLEFNNNGVKTTLSAMSINDYPNTLQVAEMYSMSVQEGYLQALKNSLSFVSNAETRPILMGINHIENSLVSTDSHQLLKSDNVHNLDDATLTVSSQTAKIVTTLINSDNVTVQYNDKYIKYHYDNVTVLGKLLDGSYPNVNRMIPTYSKVKIELSVKSVLPILEQAKGIVSKLKTKTITFERTEQNELKLIADDEQGNKLETTLPALNIEGDELKIHFTVNNFINALKQNKNENIVIDFTGNLLPFTIRATGDDSTTYLFSPVRKY